LRELIEKLRQGVQFREERWPGNDGSDVVRDIAGANAVMVLAAEALSKLIEERGVR
jgi:hypothetical protein